MAFAEVHQLSRLPDRDLLGEDAVEYMEPCLFLLVQCHFLHGRTESLTVDTDLDHFPSAVDTLGRLIGGISANLVVCGL